MADVNISKFRASVVREGSRPATPGFVVSEGQDPVNPPGTNNFVPYTGATANVELGEFGVEAGFVTLDTTPTNIPTDQGAIYWDDARSTAALIMNGTLQHIGQDSFFYVKNSSGSTIPKGTCVGFAGTEGGSGHLLVTPFLANGSVPSTYFMGVTCESIANGSFGQVMHFGELEGINTSGFTAGALLYASSTVAGGFQTTAPVAPNNIILVAAAVNSKNNGAIVVRPTLGSNFGTNESVKLTSVTDKDLLQYTVTGGVGLWENKTVAQVIGSAYVPSTRTITINGTTQDLSANRTFNVGTVTSVGLSSATSGVTIGSTPVTTSGTITLAIATASGSQNGLLSSTDWTTFNNKQNALTNPVTGTGTTNYLPKFTGSTTIGNSQVFDNGTNVGIGTATPGAKLEVKQTGSEVPFIIDSSSDSNAAYTLYQVNGSGGWETGMARAADGYSYLFSYGSFGTANSKLAITNSGNVGIGTTSPQVAGGGYTSLHVNGNGASILLSTAGANITYLYTLGTSGVDFAIENPGAQIFRAGSSERARITSGGNVLIGTTTDNGAKLQVSGSASVAGLLYTTVGNGLIVGGTGFAFAPSSTRGSVQIVGSSDRILTFGSNGSQDAYIYSAASVTQIVTTPSFSLVVGGSERFNLSASTGLATFSNNILLPADGRLYGNSATVTGSRSYLELYNGSTGDINLVTGFSSASIVFATQQGTERMRITSTGNVGIGTSSPSFQLHVNRAGNTGIFLSNTTGNSAGYLFAGGLDGLEIQSVDSSNSTAKKLMLEPYGGNVLIGTTTDAGQRLQVSGAIYASDELYLDNGKYLRFRRSSGNLSIQTLGIPSGTDDVRLLTTGDFNIVNGSLTNLMTVKNNGQVLIGVAGQDGKVAIRTNSTATYNPNSYNGINSNLRLDNGSAGAGRFSGIAFTGGGSTEGFFGVVQNASTLAEFVWQTYNGAAYGERMRMTSSGNVLINTATDNGATLNVNGTIRTANPTGSTSDSWLLGRALVSGSSTPDRWIRVQIGNLYYDILAVYMGSV